MRTKSAALSLILFLAISLGCVPLLDPVLDYVVGPECCCGARGELGCCAGG